MIQKFADSEKVFLKNLFEDGIGDRVLLMWKNKCLILI